MAETRVWKVGGRELELGARSRLVGILNVTPDSFSDGGLHWELTAAVKQAERMLDCGASLVDVGGESTRPGFEPVSAEDEIARVVPVVQELRRKRPDCILSVDTSKASVAEASLSAGASVVNDVWGFQADRALAEVAGSRGSGVVLMRNGRDGVAEGRVLDRICKSWERSVFLATEAGVDERSIVVDPGIGFGTSRQEDLEILQGLDFLRGFGFPVMLGASRKRVTAQPDGLPLEGRLEPSLAAAVAGVAAGVQLFRVHDVPAHARAMGLSDLIFRGGALHE